ncbi:2-keto-3-deoxygalactonate kinase [Planktotalea frisia]|jgi:2-dehydro-3-deoxygalactonokinase|uniref:Putative 2-dehydro-3-deoxygalactonokinase DgoK1 n=1 Tax=Planktotalea frisia TaxID=696762 RepID=A0A1L9NTY9_9RHOB|nr:2-dehydro-3-deoxygalactonokinase [Planktotalea frisia]OJI92699.1 putative 2-dehydro-3-deoxygalactonokinase DgoK1 [Planktotalea frisia]PZX24507.1 2-keto-3-deoxygalactonate kinase [Planktotalea frisia]
MNSAVSEPALIGIDWGTSSLRAFLIGTQGEVLDSVSTGEGIMQIPDRNFDAVFDRLVGSFPSNAGLPIVVSGMITSRNGWVETPYVTMPTGPEHLARSLVRHQSQSGALIHFVTGATTEHISGPDVMRGEETQIIGSAALGLSDGVFVMPGTHSKWVHVAGGKIQDFATYMTGEVFASLKDHTILGTLMEVGDFDLPAFQKGVSAAQDRRANLLHDLFHVRTLPLMGKLKETETADFLSGLLIGTEIVAALRKNEAAKRVTIVGRNDLADRYEIALQAVGISCHRAPDDIAAKGHFLIAQAAGLLT